MTAIARNEWYRITPPVVGSWSPTRRVSVIVPAKGSQDHLDRCLAALSVQTYPADLTEILVVDDASEPPLRLPSGPTVGAVAARLERHEPHGTFGAGRARNTGARAATGDALVFLDADVLVERTFLEEHLRWLHVVPYAVVTGVLGFAEFDALDAVGVARVAAGAGLAHHIAGSEHEGQIWRDRHFERSHDLTVEAPDLFRSTIGAVTTVDRSMYDEIGGYRELGVRGVEDTEFGYRLYQAGGLFVLERATRLWHQGKRSFDQGKRAAINAARRPHVEDHIPVHGFRPDPAERPHRVPRLVVQVTNGAPEAVARTRASIDAWSALDVVLTEPMAAPATTAPTGGLGHVDDLAFAPMAVEIAAGAVPGPGFATAIASSLLSGPVGVIHVLDPGGTELATAWRTRAIGRARRLGSSPGSQRSVAAALFGERWVFAEQVELDAGTARLTTIAPTTEPVSEAVDPTSSTVTATELDVVYVTDLRFPGGTSSSLVDEVQAACRAGYRVGVLHRSSPTVGTGIAVHRGVRDLIQAGALVNLMPGEAVHASLVVVKHPMVFSTGPGGRLPIGAERVVVAVGQVPGHDDGTEYYRPAEVHAAVIEALGVEPEWWPVSPVVRHRLRDVPLAEENWSEVLDLDRWPVRPARTPGPELVIGRHGRPDRLKWPATRAEVLAAYPDVPQIRVRVLGAPTELEALLDGYPERWEVLEFGSVDVRRFLDGLDVFVYHHHPDLVEAFGRTVLEAMAAGVPVVLPPSFEELFGDAARYVTAHATAAALEELHRDESARIALAERGRRAVEERFSTEAYRRRLEGLIGPARGEGTVRVAPRLSAASERELVDRPVVVVSAIGARPGSLPGLFRAIDAHRRREVGVVPIVVVAGHPPDLAGSLGIETVSITPRSRFESEIETWEDHAIRRLRQIASTYRADSVVPSDPTGDDAWIALTTRTRRSAATGT